MIGLASRSNFLIHGTVFENIIPSVFRVFESSVVVQGHVLNYSYAFNIRLPWHGRMLQNHKIKVTLKIEILF